MIIYILLLCFCVILIETYYLMKKEVMQPSIIFLAMYTFSILCAVFNVEKWGIKMSFMTFLLLLLGAIEFIVISYLINKIYDKRNKDENKIKPEQINIPHILIWIMCLYSVIVIIFQIYYVFKIASEYGEYYNLSSALTIFKEHTSYNKDTEIPDFLTIMQKPVLASAFSCTLIFINNIIIEEKLNIKYFIKRLFYILPAFLFVILSILQSNRGIVIDFIVSMMTIGIILWSKKHLWKKKLKIKTIATFGIAGIIGLIIFYYSASIVGRINSKGLFDYITFYCGGSIECLNQYVNHNEKKVEIVRGEETFYNLILNLDSFGITNYNLKENESGHLEFVYYKGEMVGNIYTAYRRWLNDYGIIGMIILQGLMSAILTVLYNKIKYTNTKSNIWILIYGYLSYTIYLHPMDGYLYLELLSIAGIATLSAIVIEYIILENWSYIKEKIKSNINKYKGKEDNGISES